jgi:hypothetical protein
MMSSALTKTALFTVPFLVASSCFDDSLKRGGRNSGRKAAVECGEGKNEHNKPCFRWGKNCGSSHKKKIYKQTKVFPKSDITCRKIEIYQGKRVGKSAEGTEFYTAWFQDSESGKGKFTALDGVVLSVDDKEIKESRVARNFCSFKSEEGPHGMLVSYSKESLEDVFTSKGEMFHFLKKVINDALMPSSDSDKGIAHLEIMKTTEHGKYFVMDTTVDPREETDVEGVITDLTAVLWIACLKSNFQNCWKPPVQADQTNAYLLMSDGENDVPISIEHVKQSLGSFCGKVKLPQIFEKPEAPKKPEEPEVPSYLKKTGWVEKNQDLMFMGLKRRFEEDMEKYNQKMEKFNQDKEKFEQDMKPFEDWLQSYRKNCQALMDIIDEPTLGGFSSDLGPSKLTKDKMSKYKDFMKKWLASVDREMKEEGSTSTVLKESQTDGSKRWRRHQSALFLEGQ